MPITKSILKNNRQNQMVHLYNDAGSFSSTIALTELVRTDETTSGTLTVGIQSMLFGTNDTSTIIVSRGTTSIALLNGGDYVDYSGIGMLLGATTGVTVNFTGPGWIILDLHKKAGYVEPQTNVGV
jgi:hypothetical protein